MKIYNLGELPESLYTEVGGKAKGLDMLSRQGFTVPAGFVITDIDSLDEESILTAFDALGVELVSVRSSASNEDQSGSSNAGQYSTFLFVDRAHLIESVKNCIDSLDAARVKDYAKHFGLQRGRMNVVVQTMIDGAKRSILITGYSLSSYFSELVDTIIKKSQCGVFVKFFV